MHDVFRYKILNDLLGKPWVANAKGPDAYDCYHLAQHVQRVIWNRTLPELEVPNSPDWKYIIRTIEESPVKKDWKEVPLVAGMPIKARDGALVVMAASVRGTHVGVWFEKERCILHVDKPDGVYFHDLMTLKMMGWQKLRFYEPLVA
jgi:hypothetical protein